jgi:uncharacterized protein (DUF1501 family)
MATIDGINAVKCADCARSDSAVTDLRPSQRVQIPIEAMTGHLDQIPRQNRYNRRAALRNGIAGVAAIYAATQIDWDQIWSAARADAAAAPNAKKIVLIYLQGGADGLNMFIPQADDQHGAYDGWRSNIGRARGASTSLTAVGSTPLAGAAAAHLGFANPLLSGASNNGRYTAMGIPNGALGLDTIYGDGAGGAGSNLAVFPAADYNPPNLSHFDSRDYWFAGQLKSTTTGWLGRWLDAEGTDNPLQAVSLDSSLSKQIRTKSAPVCAIDGLNGLQFDVRNVSSNGNNANRQVETLAAVKGSRANPALAHARGAYGLTTNVSRQIRALSSSTFPNAAIYPDSYLSDRLQLAAKLLAGGLGTRVVTIDWGSFDTHGDELRSMDPQLAVLGAALGAFQADLAFRGVADDVITVVFSEFGRRVESNESGGTDHGAGGPMMVMGPAVRGGLASEPSDIRPGKLDDNGDLKVSTDFRHVYKSIFAEWLGTDPTKYLPDLPAGDINRLDGSKTLLKAA